MMPEDSKRNIAVIAIHGVGDHRSGEMAHAVVDVLQNQRDETGKPLYSGFAEKKIRINVAPVVTCDRIKVTGVDEGWTWGPMHYLLKRVRKEVPINPAADSGVNSLDHLFMEGQIAQFKGDGPEDTYETVRLEGARKGSANEVHVYDMFWSDLSGVATAGLRIFGELYQILFHLGSVGVNNVKAAAIMLHDTPAKGAWARFNRCQSCAAAMLAWPIPLLNLLIAVLAATLFSVAGFTRLGVTNESLAVAIALLAAICGIWGWIWYSKGTAAGRVKIFSIPILLFIVLTLGCSFVAVRYRDFLEGYRIVLSEGSEAVAAALIGLCALGGASAIVCAYDKRRRGTIKVSVGIAAAVALVAAAAFLHVGGLGSSLPPLRDVNFKAMTLLLRLMEISVWLLVAAWLLFGVTASAAFVAGFFAVGATVEAEKERAARTNWTARLTLAVPASAFLLLTFLAWFAIFNAALPLLPNHIEYPCPAVSVRDYGSPGAGSALCYSPLLPPSAGTKTAAAWAFDALANAGSAYVLVLLGLILCAVLIAIWGLFPSILAEVLFPPKSDDDEGRMEHWLTAGFAFMRVGGSLLYLGMWLFPVSLITAVIFPSWLANYSFREKNEALGTIVGGGAVGLLAFGGRFSQLALGLRPAVRVALDVDNWLREHPRDSNPTARICARYTSLLRYIAQWKDGTGQGYNEIVIFAHSQGTVITADLLRFLWVEAKAASGYGRYDPTLEGLRTIKVRLLTMGCPLRQLYGQRFPYLYGYACPNDGSNDLPNPQDLNVIQWVNKYRTGDYVGRNVWQNSPPRNAEESSIGPGAHTHYWDSTAPKIAEALDNLVESALSRGDAADA